MQASSYSRDWVEVVVMSATDMNDCRISSDTLRWATGEDII